MLITIRERERGIQIPVRRGMRREGGKEEEELTYNNELQLNQTVSITQSRSGSEDKNLKTSSK